MVEWGRAHDEAVAAPQAAGYVVGGGKGLSKGESLRAVESLKILDKKASIAIRRFFPNTVATFKGLLWLARAAPNKTTTWILLFNKPPL